MPHQRQVRDLLLEELGCPRPPHQDTVLLAPAKRRSACQNVHGEFVVLAPVLAVLVEHVHQCAQGALRADDFEPAGILEDKACGLVDGERTAGPSVDAL